MDVSNFFKQPTFDNPSNNDGMGEVKNEADESSLLTMTWNRDKWFWWSFCCPSSWKGTFIAHCDRLFDKKLIEIAAQESIWTLITMFLCLRSFHNQKREHIPCQENNNTRVLPWKTRLLSGSSADCYCDSIAQLYKHLLVRPEMST